MSTQSRDPFIVKVDDFEGPLDLLLHLVRRHEMAIEQLPLGRITEEYLQALEFLSAIDLEPASDFLEVAATLLRMKARSMLPRPESIADPDAWAEEEAELLRQLVEHQVVRVAATRLRQREAQAASVWFRGEPAPPDEETGEAQIVEADLFALVAAFRSVLAGVREESPFAVSREEFPVEVSAAEIRAKLRGGRPVPFVELFAAGTSRAKLISTFLALLELIRWAEARAYQDGPFGAILIFPISPPAASEVAAPAVDPRSSDE